MSSQLTDQSQQLKPKLRLKSAFQKLWSMHWWMAACYLILFVGGFSMVRSPQNSALQENLYTFHKSVGALTIGLLIWRSLILQLVWWKKYTQRLPKFTPEWISKFLLHTAIYLSMLVVPLSGFLSSNSYQSNYVPFFWAITLPDIFPENAAMVKLAGSIHFWIAYTFLSFILLHIIEQKKYVRSFWRRTTKKWQKVENSSNN